MSTSIEIRGLDEVDARLQKAIEEFPELRRDAFVEAAKTMSGIVDASIDGSGLNDSSGKIKGFQQASVGTLGGYAAVRPVKGSGPDSPGAITRYLDDGHRVRRPGKTKPRAKMASVPGYGFYESAKAQLPALAQSIAESIAEKLHDSLEG